MSEHEDLQIDIFGGEIPLEEIETQNAICTRDGDCKAAADEHHPDCPIEAKLREEFGY